MIKTEAYNESKQFLGLTKKNGVNTSKLYTQKPLGFFSVTRNLAAYRTNQEGVLELMGANVPRIDYPITILEPARTNIMLYSQDLSNAVWTKTAVINSSTQVAPDGTNTAFAMQDNNPSGFLFFSQTITVNTNTNNTHSYFIKKSLVPLTFYSGLDIFSSGNNIRIILNNYNGTAVTSQTGTATLVSTQIENYNNDYYRVSITYKFASNTSIIFYHYPAISTNGTTTNAAAQGINIYWGFQHESGNTATAYIPTTNAPVTVPAVIQAQCPELLVENEATNVVLHSEDLANAAFSKSNCTITSNNINGPNNELTADRVNLSAGTSSKGVFQSIAIGTSTGRVFSVFAKQGTHRYIQLQIDSTNSFCNFDLLTGTIGTPNLCTANIELVNGWYKCSIYYTSTRRTAIVWAVNSLTSTIFQPTSSTGNFYLWGFQLETSTNGKATSYIPTTTTSVTRPADNVRNNTLGYDNEESTIFVRARLNFTTDYQGIATLWDNDDIYNGYITMYYYISGGVRYIAFDTYNGSDTNQYLYTAPSDGVYSIAFAYNTTSGGYKIAINGVLITDDAFPNDLPSYTLLTQTTLGSFLTYFNSRTKGFMYFDSMLDNDSLENLTVQ